MATTTTKQTGGAAILMTATTFTAPERALLAEDLAEMLPDSGLNGPFIADLLSSFLAHEQCGFHLYRSAISLTTDATLKQRYEEFCAETEEHIRIFEDLIAACGGRPGYVSAAARLVEAADSKLHEAAVLLCDGADVPTLELAILEAVLLAETKCHADWSLIQKMTALMPEGAGRAAFQAAVDQVEDQEDEHVTWARSTWEQMIMTQATSGAAPPG